MTRRSLNADGTLTLKSFSYFGLEEHAAEAFRREVAEIDEHNHMALADWGSLTSEEQQHRIRVFEAGKREFRAPAVRWEGLPSHSQDEQHEIPTFL
jgi:hypothetical protein